MTPLEILERRFRSIDLPRTSRVGCPICGTALIGIVRRLYDHALAWHRRYDAEILFGLGLRDELSAEEIAA